MTFTERMLATRRMSTLRLYSADERCTVFERKHRGSNVADVPPARTPDVSLRRAAESQRTAGSKSSPKSRRERYRHVDRAWSHGNHTGPTRQHPRPVRAPGEACHCQRRPRSIMKRLKACVLEGLRRPCRCTTLRPERRAGAHALALRTAEHRICDLENRRFRSFMCARVFTSAARYSS